MAYEEGRTVRVLPLPQAPEGFAEMLANRYKEDEEFGGYVVPLDLAQEWENKAWVKRAPRKYKRKAKASSAFMLHDTHPEQTTKMLFISHTSKDEPVVEALVELCRNALAIPPRDIRCTSLDGSRLPGGARISDRLREEVNDAQAFVGLISYNSLQSMYVVFELGARWGAAKSLIPLLAPGVEPDILEGPLSELNPLRCGDAAQLHQLVDELAQRLGVASNPPATYQRYIDKILALPPAPKKPIVPEYLLTKLNLDFAARKGGLTPTQKELLDYLEQESKKRASIPQKDFELVRITASAYWRLETLCYLGFMEKEVTGDRGGKQTFNYRLSPEYSRFIAADRG